MKRFAWFVPGLLCLAASVPAAPQQPPAPTETTVFTAGAEGYPRFRIPAAVVTTRGTFLAFAEGRTGGDSGDIDLVCKRSSDGGKTWGPLQVIWDDGKNTCGNPAPVVDAATGTIWLLMTWNLGTDDEKTILAGTSKDVRHVYVTHSDDDGKTWAKPTKISDSARKPHWRWYATGPGNGIQLTQGKHKGRLVIPCNHSDHSQAGHPYRSHVLYSDDHGKTWAIGGVEEDRTNESAVAELADGALLHAMRSYHGKGLRAMAVSKDAGQSWGPVYLDAALETPVCQASLVRYSWPDEQGGKSRLLFCSPAGKKREHLTVWVSHDEGKTWPVHKEVYAGGSGYSSLVALPDGKVGVLYEKDGAKTVTFATFALEWLEGPQPGVKEEVTGEFRLVAEWERPDDIQKSWRWQVGHLLFSADGRELTASYGPTDRRAIDVQTWELASRRVRRCSTVGKLPDRLWAYSADHKYAVTEDEKEVVSVVRVQDAKILVTLTERQRDAMWHFSEDGRFVLLMDRSVKPNSFRCLDTASGRESEAVDLEDVHTSVVISGDGSLVVWSCRDGGFRVGDLTSGMAIHHLVPRMEVRPKPKLGRSTLLISPCKTYLLTWDSRAAFVRLWNLETGKECYVIETPWLRGGFDCAAAFSPNGKMLALGSDRTGTIRVFETATGKQRFELRSNPGSVTALAFSSDGSLLASGNDDGHVALWRVWGRVR